MKVKKFNIVGRKGKGKGGGEGGPDRAHETIQFVVINLSDHFIIFI